MRPGIERCQPVETSPGVVTLLKPGYCSSQYRFSIITESMEISYLDTRTLTGSLH